MAYAGSSANNMYVFTIPQYSIFEFFCQGSRHKFLLDMERLFCYYIE